MARTGKYAPEHHAAMTREQIAKVLGISVRAVEWAEQSAVKKLKASGELGKLQAIADAQTFYAHAVPSGLIRIMDLVEEI